MEIAELELKGSSRDKIVLTHPALPSFMGYISAVFLASSFKPFPNSSSSMARFLTNTDASCRGKGDGEGGEREKDAHKNTTASRRRKLTMHDIMLCWILSSNKGTPHLMRGVAERVTTWILA